MVIIVTALSLAFTGTATFLVTVYGDGPCNWVKSNGKCSVKCNDSIFFKYGHIKYSAVWYGTVTFVG